MLKKLTAVVLVALVSGAVLTAQSQGQGQRPPAIPSLPPAPAPDAGATGKSRIIQRVIVKVNGEIFTETDLVDLQIQGLQEKNRVVRTPADLQNDATLKAAVIEITPGILVDAVDELLMVQHGREAGYKMTEDKFKNYVDGLKKDNKLDDAGLKAAMAEQGITLESLHEQVERRLIYQSVQQYEIMERAQLTDAEKKDYYDKHPDEFMTPSTVTLREIFIKVASVPQNGQPTFSVGQDNDVRKRIESVRERAQNGEDFTKLVAEVSESGTKANAGLIGPVSTGDLSDSLRDLLSKMKPGEITDPIRTPTGYQILKLESKSESSRKAFADVSDELSQKVFESRMNGETQKFLTKLRQQALIEWKDEGMKQAYEKELAERVKSQAAGK
jgi:peptidyl-prolyl cis-trans isomerase SurA